MKAALDHVAEQKERLVARKPEEEAKKTTTEAITVKASFEEMCTQF
jgi:hypothetical protein